MTTISRRAFLQRLARASVALGATSLAGAGYSYYVEPGWLSVERVDAPIRELPPGLHGLRVAQLSDLHIGPAITADQIGQAAAAANAEQPDLIVLTGDYVSGPARNLLGAIEQIASLRAPLGVYGVLGNHDHWSGAPDAIVRELSSAGVRVLRNEHVRISHGGGDIWLAGVDDVWEERANLPATLDGIPRGAPTVLLAHEPDFADTTARYDIALQLSGHSHGGQVRLPLLGAPVLPWLGQRYPIGLQRVPGTRTHVYTNRGIGMVDPAVRLNCRPELTVIRLING